MASTRIPTTEITFSQAWSFAHNGVTENMAAVTAGISAQAQQSAFNAIKQWEDTRSVTVGPFNEKVHDKGYERIGEILSTTTTPGSVRIVVKKPRFGPRKWQWSGSGVCEIKVRSFSEDAPH